MIDDEDIKKLSEVFATKDDVIEFKDEILTGQDEILGKLEILLQEKTMGDEQEKRKKRGFEIHNNALKRSKILLEKEIVEIDKLNVL